RLSVACIYSGRLPELLPAWIDAVAGNVREANSSSVLSEPADLTILDNSATCADALYRETARHGECYSSVRIVPHPAKLSWQSEGQRQNEVSRFLANATTRLLSL